MGDLAALTLNKVATGEMMPRLEQKVVNLKIDVKVHTTYPEFLNKYCTQIVKLSKYMYIVSFYFDMLQFVHSKLLFEHNFA